MINIEFTHSDYQANLQSLAGSIKSIVSNNSLLIPPFTGEGFAWAENLPSGISVFIFKGIIKDDYTVARKAIHNKNIFLLEFNEVVPPKNLERRKLPANAITQSAVMLSTTLKDVEYLVPAGTSVSSVQFFFSKENLIQILPEELAVELINNHFSSAIKNNTLEPIDRVYRVMLDELIVDNISHPLKLNFIQNRVLLLLEKYLVKLYNKNNVHASKRNKDDEIARLTQIEGLLVKDFSVAPPTIGELSIISAMSPTKLKNDFKSVYGLPIYEYYQKNRMLKAKSLLLERKYSIKQVGILVGYTNLSHFANTFKKEFGILPSELASKDGMLVYNL